MWIVPFGFFFMFLAFIAGSCSSEMARNSDLRSLKDQLVEMKIGYWEGGVSWNPRGHTNFRFYDEGTSDD